MDHVEVVVTRVVLPEGDCGRVLLYDVPADRVRAQLPREELIEENDETLADITVVKVFPAIKSLGLVILIRSPVPLGGAEGVKMILDVGSYSIPHPMTGDDPLVCSGHHDDVDQDDLLAPVVTLPELQVAVLTRKPVSYQLKKCDFYQSRKCPYLKKGN